MLSVALRGLATRKLRAVLTAFAVILGVAMVTGTYVMTDTIDRSFEEVFDTGYAGVDVSVAGREYVDTEFSAPAPIDAALLSQVRGVEGVALAEGSVFDEARLRTADDEKIGGEGPPSFVASIQDESFDAFEFVEGRAPATAQEAGIDRGTAEDKDLAVGDTLVISGEAPAKRYTITGVAQYGDVDSIGGAVALLPLAEAQRVLGKQGKFDGISVAAEDGLTPAALKQRIAGALPDDVAVRTGDEEAATQSDDISESFSFLQTALLAFGGIALFVGAFIIYNTFSITVAQRTRELALLRTLGASRRQVLRTVLVEALVIGLVASLLGLAGGLLVAPGLFALFSAIGADLPQTGTVVATRTIVVALVVGVLVTVVASLAPALRATRVAPIAALREGYSPEGEGKRHRVRLAFAGVLMVGGLVALLVGLFGGGSDGAIAGALIGGALAIFLGVALISPLLVRPLAGLIGRPIEAMGGMSGRLARENAMRNPGRTAVTAAALMVGLALVSFVTIFAAGAKSSTNDSIDRSFAGDYVIQNEDGFSPLSGASAQAVSRVDGVEAAAAVTFPSGVVQGVDEETTSFTGVDVDSFPRVYALDWDEGSDATLRGLGTTGAVVESGWAEDHGVEVGDALAVTTPIGKRTTYEVRGAIDDSGGLIGTGVVLPRSTIVEDFGEQAAFMVLVGLAEGASDTRVRQQIDAVLARDFPGTETLSQTELKEEIAGQIDQILMLVYALLSLSVIVSLFGIVNTLVLSIHERTRELGLLRAVGTSRRQVRRIVRQESVITALIGATLGLALGVALALLIAQPLGEDGFELSFPIGTLLILLVLAAVAGVLAAIPPARRASRIDVLEALAYE